MRLIVKKDLNKIVATIRRQEREKLLFLLDMCMGLVHSLEREDVVVMSDNRDFRDFARKIRNIHSKVSQNELARLHKHPAAVPTKPAAAAKPKPQTPKTIHPKYITVKKESPHGVEKSTLEITNHVIECKKCHKFVNPGFTQIGDTVFASCPECFHTIQLKTDAAKIYITKRYAKASAK